MKVPIEDVKAKFIHVAPSLEVQEDEGNDLFADFEEDNENEVENYKFKLIADRNEMDALQSFLYSDEGMAIEQQLNAYFQTVERTPNLLEAKIGDFVLIYSDFSYTPDDECNVGLVTSKTKGKDGKNWYGVGYIQFIFADRFLRKESSGLYDTIFISEEDYGGYHRGFLKIFSKEEAIEVLNKKLQHAYDKALKDLKDNVNKSKSIITELVNTVTDTGSIEQKEVFVLPNLSDDYDRTSYELGEIVRRFKVGEPDESDTNNAADSTEA